jgi:tetratricopeptide (TPR) repeat protein
MMWVLSLCLLCMWDTHLYSVLPGAYDRAIMRAHDGNWDDALQQLQTVLVDAPQNASVLYDVGVAAFNVEDTTHAADYFEQSAQHATTDSLLQEKAWINAGTAYAKNNDFVNGVRCIEKALLLNPANESAQKKLEEFKKKRDEQEREKEKEQEKQSQPQDQPQDQDQNQEQDQENQQQEQQKQQEPGDEDESENGAEGTQPQQGENGEREHGNDENERESADSKSGTDGKPQQPTHEKQSQLPQQEQAADMTDAPHTQEQNDEISPADTQEQQKKSMALHEALQKEENQWMCALLEKYDQHDVEGNKQLLRCRVQSRGGNQPHDKNW